MLVGYRLIGFTGRRKKKIRIVPGLLKGNEKEFIQSINEGQIVGKLLCMFREIKVSSLYKLTN